MDLFHQSCSVQRTECPLLWFHSREETVSIRKANNSSYKASHTLEKYSFWYTTNQIILIYTNILNEKPQFEVSNQGQEPYLKRRNMTHNSAK
jgi:hypothetical protein